MMLRLLCHVLSLLVVGHCTAVKNCHHGCRCEVENFGQFDSFSLTRVDCSGLGPAASMPVPIPLDTTHLDLSSNTMGPLSDSMLTGPGYTTLISLDLSSNHITEISPNALRRLRYLENLDLRDNSLESLSSRALAGLPLAEVDLSYNRFQNFDMDVFATKVNGEPVIVDLSHNQIRSVTRGDQGGVPFIQSLSLSANHLTDIPALGGLPLRYLNLDDNPIVSIPEGAFSQLKDLVHLSLSGMSQLRDVQPYGFQGLQSLQVLDLSENPELKTLSLAVFSGLGSLQELNLSYSGVLSLPGNMLAHLPSIKSITLGQGIHCRRTQKQGQFHWQLGQVTHNDVLTCNVDGVMV
ncbi:tsukushi [Gadus morhua]|uniref:Tsukushi small leucine rich proteoglycan homolog (Xenopus laevis) n=1 Tax=Gadus morhua TaxID=8049 RepID=A0A8C5A044_GADMO|nr:tsukushin [Gadus morhua]XP_030237274.1 tsukushin [Gadus morhua]